MKKQGFEVDDAYVRERLYRKINKPRNLSSVKEDGLVYLYSNNSAILKKLSPEIADKKGLVMEGSSLAVQEFLNPNIKDQVLKEAVLV